MRRITRTALHNPRINSRVPSPSTRLLRCVPRLAPPIVATRSSLGPSSLPSGSFSSTSGSSNGSPAALTSKFPPPTDAASVPFPGTGLRVSRVGFGSPWMGAGPDRGLDMSRALSDGQCNIVQLTSEVKKVNKHDKDGKPLLVPEWPQRSWETRTFETLEIPREDLALVWELPAAGKPVKKALSPSRAMVHLDRLLVYHGLSYVDAFIMEIPWIKGGEGVVNDYRRFTGEAVRLAMTEFLELAGDKVKTLGFSWQANPHTPHPGRAPDSPLSDVIELRDMLMPGKPVVAMFPVGVGSGAIVDDLDTSNGGVFGLPESAGVFQIGTSVTHSRREDGRPFRMVDVSPRPIAEIMSDLKSMFGMAIHMEVEYAKRFEQQGQGEEGDEVTTQEGEGEGGDKETPPPLPPKADVSWAHILAQNQHQLQGLDEWETIRDGQIKPAVTRALDTLRIRGDAEGEWGFLYRSTLGSLMSGLSETMEVRKFHQLEEASTLMDELAPSLKSSVTGGGGGGVGGDGEEGAAGKSSSSAGCSDGSVSGETVKDATVIGRCTAAALGTGVDCVLTEEFSASRDPARTRGFAQVPGDEMKRLLSGFKLPKDS